MDRITDRPDMTSAVYRGRKASTQTNKTKPMSFPNMLTCSSKYFNWISGLDGPASVVLSIFETTLTSAETTLIGALMCMFEGQKIP